MLQIPVSDSRGEAGVNGVTFSVVLKARCRQRVPWSKRCNGPIIDKQITRRRSTWIKQPPPPNKMVVTLANFVRSGPFRYTLARGSSSRAL